jgi:hypothetical protein
LTPLDLLILSAATWYISFALTNTDGPGGVFARAREWHGGAWHGRGKHPMLRIDTDTKRTPVMVDGYGLLDCIVCLSLWIALLLALLTGHTVLDGIAIAGVSLWVHGFTGWRIKL